MSLICKSCCLKKAKLIVFFISNYSCDYNKCINYDQTTENIIEEFYICNIHCKNLNNLHMYYNKKNSYIEYNFKSYDNCCTKCGSDSGLQNFSICIRKIQTNTLIYYKDYYI
jgi:hypothetical protein